MRYHFGDFAFDSDNLRLEGPQGERALRPMSTRVLHALLEEAPGLLRHDELLDRVWGRQEVTPGVLSHSIREIRSALGDSAREPRFIETRHRLGYCFIAAVRAETAPGEPLLPSVATVPEATREDVKPIAHQADPAIPTASPWRRALPALVIVLLLTLGVWLWGLSSERMTPGASSAGIEFSTVGQPQEPEALRWYRQGMQALQRGDLLQAQSWLERSRAREPGATATLVALADRAAQAGNRIGAREWFAAAEAAGRTLPRVEQLRIAARQAALDYRWDAAIAHWIAISQLDPGDVGSSFELFDAQLASGRPGKPNRP